MKTHGFNLKYKRDVAGYLGINRSTLYNWKKDRPNLYKTVMMGLKTDEAIETIQNQLDELKKLQLEFGGVVQN